MIKKSYSQIEEGFCVLFNIVTLCFSFCMIETMENKLPFHSNQSLKYLLITNPVENISISVLYDNKTTLLNIKQWIEKKEQIAVSRQKLIVVVPSTDLDFIHYIEKKIINLPDDLRIQEIIENYRSIIRLELGF